MKMYVVGGAVRDRLLGLPVRDRDYVVIGGTPEAMREAGFRPVGKDFPVFLHPHTQEEYALARTERKVAPGYTGFIFHAAPEVTLEQDLQRRDLTINAMAEDEQGRLIDPYDGQADLAQGVLRHVSSAFAEDPVRILRLARFAARFSRTDGSAFTIAPETHALMCAMVKRGEVDALVPERIWQECARGLMEAHPERLIEVLRACGALARILPEIDRLFGVPQPPRHHPEIDTGTHILLALAQAAQQHLDLPSRWAVLLHDVGKGVTPAANWPHHYGHEALGIPLIEAIGARLKVPREAHELAILCAREHGNIGRACVLRPGTLYDLLLRCDALRRPERFHALLAAVAADHRGRTGYAHQPFEQAVYLLRAREELLHVDAGALARNFTGPPGQLPEHIRQARLRHLRDWVLRMRNRPDEILE